jgi:hypothetical protein
VAVTESQFTQKLLKALRARLPQAVIIKFNDQRTSGIPDVVIVNEGRATWLEVKNFDQVKDIFSHHPLIGPSLDIPLHKVPALQWETLRRLKRGCLVVKGPGHWCAVLHIANTRGSVRRWQAACLPFSDFVNKLIDISRWEKI